MVDILPEKWMKGVAVTTTCLAVLTAIAASRGAACGARTQLLTAIESSKWAYYQAKSIKQNLAETQKNGFEVEILGAKNPEQQAYRHGETPDCHLYFCSRPDHQLYPESIPDPEIRRHRRCLGDQCQLCFGICHLRDHLLPPGKDAGT